LEGENGGNMHQRGFVIIFVCQALAFVLTLGTAVLYRLSYMRRSHAERSIGVARLSLERLTCACALDFLNDKETKWNGRTFIMEINHGSHAWFAQCVVMHDHRKSHENFLKLEIHNNKNECIGSVGMKIIREGKRHEWTIAAVQFGPSL
jgi:hypothetical protein